MLSICYQKVVPKVRVELTRGHPHRFLSLVRTILVSRLIVLTNVWVRRFRHQVPSGQYLIPINETALHGSNEFELASLRASARRASESERSRSASATVGAMFGVRLSPVSTRNTIQTPQALLESGASGLLGEFHYLRRWWLLKRLAGKLA